jgi:peptidoglycan/LPS O-acetylase OafA/YrhL
VATWPLFFLATHENDMYYRWAFCLGLGCVLPWFQEIRFRPLEAAAHVIAKYSYGIYLSHVAVIMWCFSLPISAPMKWAVFAMVASLCPVAMYHFIEHPLIAAGQRFSKYVFERDTAADRAVKD